MDIINKIAKLITESETTSNMRYRRIFFDGSRGWRLGEFVEVEQVGEFYKIIGDDQMFRDENGILMDDERQTMLIPLNQGDSEQDSKSGCAVCGSQLDPNSWECPNCGTV